MSGSGDGFGFSDDLKLQAMDAVGDMANSFPVETQLEEPPVPPETFEPLAETGDFNSYEAEAFATMQAGDPPPLDPPTGPFPVEDVDPGELQTPLDTPQVSGPQADIGDFDRYGADFQAAEPEAYEPVAGPFPVEDVDPGELQQPLDTPQMDAEPEPS